MKNDRLVKACRREKTDKIPIWLMRQVGRYLPEYREIRKKHSFLEICQDPEIVAELTAIPIRRFNLDGAIIFSDILIPMESIGFNITIKDDIYSKGRIKINKISSEKDLERLDTYTSEKTYFVYEGIRLAKRLLNHSVPIIGFAGAPFTLACYLIEGGISGEFRRVKYLMYSAPEFWDRLMRILSRIVYDHVKAQINAGAEVIQIFDTWAGVLSPSDYRIYVLPYIRVLMKKLTQLETPIIHFATCCAGILDLMKEAGGDVIGVDWRIDIEVAWHKIGYDTAIQGNLDPVILLTNRGIIRREVERMLTRVGGRRGYIFNLVHGVVPNTPPENVKFLVEIIPEDEVN